MSNKKMKKILVTGSTGQIGSELTLELRKRHGGQNVIAATHKKPPNEELKKTGPYEQIDLTNEKTITEAVKKHDIDTIYHLAAVLSATGEENPQSAWNINIGTLYNILEVARKEKLQRVFWPSSIAAFGPTAPRISTPQETILIPTTMYGVSKVAGELLCNYYYIKYKVDVRSVRYPGIISSEVLPGGGTTDYAVAIFYEAIKKKYYTCFVRENTVLPMMYMPDCTKATLDLMQADPTKVKRHDSYNIAGMSFSAGQLTKEIQKHIPDFTCDYKPDSRQAIANSWPMSIDDTVARKDWNWKPDYDLASVTRDMIEKLAKRYREGKL